MLQFPVKRYPFLSHKSKNVPWRTLNIAKCDHQDSTIMTFDKADQVAKSAPLTIMSSERQGRPRGFIIYDASIQDKYPLVI